MLEKWLLPLKIEGCDIIICVSHTRGETITFVEDLGEELVRYVDCGGGQEQDNEKITQFKNIFRGLFDE